jgi:putative membrane protein
VKIGAIVGGAVGIGLAVWLLTSYGVGRVLAAVLQVGWIGMIAIVLFHLPQMLCSALGWQAIAGSKALAGGKALAGSKAGGAPSADPLLPWRTYFALRWIREAVNNLLPLAQIGGELVAARLLQRRGTPLAHAIGGTVADLLLELATQVLFTVLGVFLLVQLVGQSEVTALVTRGLLFATLIVVAAFAALWLGVARLLERAVLSMGRSLGWPATEGISGLHARLVGCFRSPARVALAGFWHLASWLLGGIEVCLILHFCGSDVGIATGLIIESLGQAAKSVGFAVPGAVGVQEGGYVLIGRALGISPEISLALSLVKRLREVVLGLPALILWHRAAARSAIVPLV